MTRAEYCEHFRKDVRIRDLNPEKKQTVTYHILCDVRPCREEVFDAIFERNLKSEDYVRPSWLQHEVWDAKFRVLCMRYLVFCF